MGKARTALACLLLVGGMLSGCGGGAGQQAAADYVADQSDPAKVLQAVFDIANGASSASLGLLCDPLHQNDLDTQRICDEADGVDPLGSFAQYFRTGKALSEPLVAGDSAWIAFQYGPTGAHQDTLCLIRRADRWYLLNFGPDAAL